MRTVVANGTAKEARTDEDELHLCDSNKAILSEPNLDTSRKTAE